MAGVARNIGTRATRGELCVMIDSDCVAAPDLVARLVARHEAGEYAAVAGSIANGTPASPSGWVGYLIEFKDFMPTAPARPLTTAPTAVIAYRRSVLERSGGFDSTMWLAEDILLNWQLHRSGARFWFEPAARVTHLNRTGWREVLRYQRVMGRYSAIARQRGELPGQLFLRRPGLIALLPVLRLLGAVRWLWQHDRRALGVLLLLWPMYLVAAAFWARGFYEGTRSEEPRGRP